MARFGTKMVRIRQIMGSKTIWELKHEQIEYNIDFGYYIEKEGNKTDDN